jgi:hypothetical protein
VHVPSIRHAVTPGGVFQPTPGLDENATGVIDDLLQLTTVLAASRLDTAVG